MRLSQSQKSLLWLGLAALLLIIASLVLTLGLSRSVGSAGVIDTPARVALRDDVHSDDPSADLPIEQFLPNELLQLDPKDAMSRNLALPISKGPNPVAPAFAAKWLGPDLEAATQCLTTAVYYESAGEPIAGQRGVAQVILNRLRNPRYPKTICGVVYQGAERSGCQFSFACDGSLRRVPNAAGWATAKAAAVSVLNGMTSYEVGQATHYHTMAVFPAWAPQLAKIGIIGHHVFYRPPGTRTFDYGLIYKAPDLDAPALVEAATVLPPPTIAADTQLSGGSIPSAGAPASSDGARSSTTTARAGPVDTGASGAAEPRPQPSETPRSNFAIRRARSPNLPLASGN